MTGSEPGSGRPHPTVDDVEFRALYAKSAYVVDTADGWALTITRYRPVPQTFPQPLFGEPILLVHGFSQNRHAWTSGEFVKNLLYFGLDIHILELRGHGKSSIQLQVDRARKFGKPPPPDLDYGWDLDSYFLYDVPAAVAGVRRVTRRERIFYCGHSMGGILGYGYAGIHPDHFEGLVTVGAPAELGKGNLPLKLLAFSAPSVARGLDAVLGSVNTARTVGRKVRGLFTREPEGGDGELTFRYVPVDAWQRAASDALGYAEESPLLGLVRSRITWLTRWDRMSMDTIRWLLKEGGEKETRLVIEQFARWIRTGRIVCYRTGYDFQRGFGKIKIPMAIIFGDLDPLASVSSTRSVYHEAQSEYLLWRPVKGNSHIELTMGHDIRQICYDIKNLVEYARTHRSRSPSLPRIRS